ncbi:ABC transporter permease [Bacillus cihuensis]|uniref:ABC transporter permease n=1 Tax=Bacillus cihuensis TaxID=1208599 RepID=UPI0003F64F1F|nr:ABC transporter permease subunit [Bacillus cihuensis]
MTTFISMFQKEWKELMCTYKIIYVPIAFAILMISFPLSMKLLPDLLASEMPKGAVIEIPELPTSEMMSAAFSNFELMGVIILVLISMGSIAGEREKGVAAMVLVKPVSRAVYLLAKWSAYSLLAVGSFIFGMLLTAYYTNLLFSEKLIWANATAGILLYLPIIVLIITFSISASSISKTPVTAGFTAVVLYLLTMNIPKLFQSSWANNLPHGLVNGANEFMKGNIIELAGPLLGTVLLISLVLTVAITQLKRQEI